MCSALKCVWARVCLCLCVCVRPVTTQVLPNAWAIVVAMQQAYNSAMKRFLSQIRREDRSEARAATHTAARRHTLSHRDVVPEAQASPPKLAFVPLGRKFPSPIAEADPAPTVTASGKSAVVPLPSAGPQPPGRHVRGLSRAIAGSSESNLDITGGAPMALGPPPLLRRKSEELSIDTTGFGSVVAGTNLPPPALAIPETASDSKGPQSSRVWAKPSSDMFSPTYAIPPPRRQGRNAGETMNKLWVAFKPDMTLPLSSVGDLLSVIGVCVVAKDSSVLFPYFPNRTGGAASIPAAGSSGALWLD